MPFVIYLAQQRDLGLLEIQDNGLENSNLLPTIFITEEVANPGKRARSPLHGHGKNQLIRGG